MTRRRTNVGRWLVALVAAPVMLGACASPPSASTPQTPQAAQDSNRSAVNRQILAALRERRYADAMALTRRAPVSAAERDFALGTLALEGLADSHAAQPPPESVDGALSLLEAAALADPEPAVSTLASTFERGLQVDSGQAVLIAPNPELAQCWRSVPTAPAAVRRCVSLRARGR